MCVFKYSILLFFFFFQHTTLEIPRDYFIEYQITIMVANTLKSHYKLLGFECVGFHPKVLSGKVTSMWFLIILQQTKGHV